MTDQTFNMVYNRIEELAKPEVIVDFMNMVNSNFSNLNDEIK